MNIEEVFNLLKANKSVAILTPSAYEQKLLYDRIRLYKKNIKVLDNNTFEYNKKRLIITYPDQIYLLYTSAYIIIEFPEQLPSYIFAYLPPTEVITTTEEIN